MKKLILFWLLMPLCLMAQPIRFQYYTTNLAPAISPSGTNAVNNIISTNLGNTTIINTIISSNRLVTNIVVGTVGGTFPIPATQGDMLYYGLTEWLSLPKGSPQQMLAMDSSDPRPVWTWDLNAMSNFPSVNLLGNVPSGKMGTNGGVGRILEDHGTYAGWVTPTNLSGVSATNVFETSFGIGLTATTNTFLYDVSLDTNYVNSLITNQVTHATNSFSLTVPVLPNNVNMDRLFNFRNAVMHSNRPVNVMVTTDQIDNGGEWPGAAMAPLRGLLLSEGGIQSGGSTEGCLLHTLSPANAWQPPDDSNPVGIYLGTANYLNLTNGGYVTFYRNSSSGVTNVYADTFKLFYLKEPRGATFTIQTNNAGSTWGTVATGNMFGTGTNLIVTNISLPLANYSVRVLNTGAGTNRIRTASLYNSTTNQIFSGGFLVNAGGDWTIMADAYTNVSWPYWQAMNPDLILLQDEGPTNDVVALDRLEQMFTNVCPHADVIYIGQFWASHDAPGTSNDIAYYNSGLRSQALKYNRGFFDSQFYIPNREVHDYYTNIGLINVDGAHVNKGGSDLLVAGLWKSFFAESIVNPPYSTSTKYSGKGAQFLNGYVGNLYGGVTNNGVFVFNDGGNYSYVYSPGSGSMSLKLAPNGRDTLSSDASDLVSFGGTNGVYFWAFSPFNVAGQLWPNGGWTFGSGGPSSPGANSVQVMGNVIWGTGATNILGSAGSFVSGVGHTNGILYANGLGLSNAVEVVAGTGISVTTNDNKRTFVLSSTTGDSLWFKTGTPFDGITSGGGGDYPVTVNTNGDYIAARGFYSQAATNFTGFFEMDVEDVTHATQEHYLIGNDTTNGSLFLDHNSRGFSNPWRIYFDATNGNIIVPASAAFLGQTRPPTKGSFSGNYTVNSTNAVLFCVGTNQVITLPNATTTPVGTMITVICATNSGGSSVIVTNANGSQNIMGALKQTISLTNRITIINDGGNWW